MPEYAARPDLRPDQFEFLLAMTGVEDMWRDTKAADIEAYARKRGLAFRERIDFNVALEITGLPEAELAALWDKAATF